MAIITQIEAGVEESGSRKLEDLKIERSGQHGYIIEPDREKAIQQAVDMADAEDLILIAGKGHEDYQILGDRTIHFDDREVAARAVADLGK